ncbi:MAG: hypothetical protein ACKVS7_07710 [Gemmatimonadaceae bacterium]
MTSHPLLLAAVGGVLICCGTPAVSVTQEASRPPVIELRGGRWFDGERFAAGSRWVQGEHFVARPRRGVADSVVSLDGLYLVPPYGDAHTHSPDGPFGFEAIHDMYMSAGVFYVQVLTNHRSGRLAMGASINAPGRLDAQFADGAVTSSGGHPQLLYESLALFRTTFGDSAQRKRAAVSLTQNRDAYHLLDSLSQLPPLVKRLRLDTLALLKVVLIEAEQHGRFRDDPSKDGSRGVPPELLKPLVDSAHAMGRRVWAHVETASDFELAHAAGVDGFAHIPGYGAAFVADSSTFAMRLSADVVKRLARRPVPVVTTLGLSRDSVRKDAAAGRRAQDVAMANVRLLAKAGFPILTGSDTYSSREAIENDHLSVAEALGMSPKQHLRLRTIDTPRAIFPGRAITALKLGHEASLLALRCDPLRDITCQSDIARRMKQGMWITVDSARAP